MVHIFHNTISQRKTCTDAENMYHTGGDMTTKEWLNRGRVLAKEIEKMLKAGPGDDVDAARAEIEKKVSEWIVLKIDLVNAITKLSDRRERVLLINYYCNRMSWTEAAADLGLTYQHVCRIRKSALKNMEAVLNKGGIL